MMDRVPYLYTCIIICKQKETIKKEESSVDADSIQSDSILSAKKQAYP